MKKNLHVKKGDQVVVISGESKDKKGKIISVDRIKERAIVEGLNLVSRHTKPNAKNPDGGIIKKEAPLHVSKLMVLKEKEVAKKTSTKTTSKAAPKATKTTKKKESK